MGQDTIASKCGTVSLDAEAEVVAGTFNTWSITYTVGQIGMDDGSRLKIAVNQSSDWGPPQFDNPTEDNYCSVTTSGTATVSADYQTRGYQRPWQDTIDIDVGGGALTQGDRITLMLGDRSQGSMGIQAQSYAETDFRFRAFVDPFETEEYVELPDDLTFDIVSGLTKSLEAVAPSDAQVGEEVKISIRAEDFWGNPARDSSTIIRFEGPESANLPDPVTITNGVAHAPLSFGSPGDYRVTIIHDKTGAEATTNAITCREAGRDTKTFWGDIHGQSGETVGTGTIREYLEYARDKAFLDFASHAGNDFQITDEFWEQVQQSIRDFHTPHEFATFLCYEWSANTPNGGDHNVYFRDDEAEIHRSSNWQSKAGTERVRGTYPVSELYERYAGRDDVLIIPHQGGRPATLEEFDPKLTPFVEIVSVWGIFEWFGQEALERGYPVGFVGGTDDHTGRPGASTPANVVDWAFPIDGGLMGVKAESLTRDSLWDAFKSRRVFATTGSRINLETSIDGHPMGAETTVNGQVEVDVSVHGTAPLRGIDLFRGTDRIATREFNEGSSWIECLWTGARAKTRHKMQDWTGGLSIDRGRITEIKPFGFDHPQQGILSQTDTSVRWNGSTAGNSQGIRFQIDAPNETKVRVSTPAVTTSCTLNELEDGHTVDGGGVGRRLELSRVGVSTTVDADITFKDRDVPKGNHPYYVRVRQEDSEMAWSSPIFVTIE